MSGKEDGKQTKQTKQTLKWKFKSEDWVSQQQTLGDFELWYNSVEFNSKKIYNI